MSFKPSTSGTQDTVACAEQSVQKGCSTRTGYSGVVLNYFFSNVFAVQWLSFCAARSVKSRVKGTQCDTKF